VNARAKSLEPKGESVAPRAEHISLESTPDVTTTPARHPHRKTLSTYKLHSSLRRSQTEISILDDHYLSVSTQQANEPAKKYVLDLRFANPRPLVVRHVAWVCLGSAIALLLATCGAFWWAFAASTSPWTHPGLTAGACGVLATCVALLLCLRRTTESLQFISVHGEAILVNITGGIGSAKSGRRFFVDVIRNISAAKIARPQARQQFLRDEMREHHRLHELRVLSDADYEASRARILASHS